MVYGDVGKHVSSIARDIPRLLQAIASQRSEYNLLLGNLVRQRKPSMITCYVQGSHSHVNSQKLTSTAADRLPSSGQQQLSSSVSVLHTVPHNGHSNVLLSKPTQESESHSHGPQLHAIASQMDAHSAELLRHVSVAMSKLPAAPGAVPGVQGSHAQQRYRAVDAGSSGLPSHRNSSLVQSHGYIHNPLFVNTASKHQPDRMQEVPTSFSDLISRIRLTEGRLQEAITSLTDATHRFQEEIPHNTVIDPMHKVLCQPDAVQPSHAAHVSTLTPLNQKNDRSESAIRQIASPLRSLEWTQLNPLYPASSCSISPESQLTSHPVSRTPSPLPLAANTVEFSTPQHKDSFVSAASERGGQVRVSQQSIVEHLKRSKKVLPLGHGGNSGATMSGPVIQPPIDVAPRQSADESMVSMSSTWSLEHPVQDDRNVLDQPANARRVKMADNVHRHGIRVLYSGSSSDNRNDEKMIDQGRCRARPVAASVGHIGIHSLKGVDVDECFDHLPESTSLPGWTTANPGMGQDWCTDHC